MAQSRISLDTALLRSSAAQVKGIAGNLESELHSLESIINSTADAWEGPAKDSFEKTFQTTYKKNLTEIYKSLESYAKAMEQFANDNDELTRSGARRFESIMS